MIYLPLSIHKFFMIKNRTENSRKLFCILSDRRCLTLISIKVFTGLEFSTSYNRISMQLTILIRKNSAYPGMEGIQ